MPSALALEEVFWWAYETEIDEAVSRRDSADLGFRLLDIIIIPFVAIDDSFYSVTHKAYPPQKLQENGVVRSTGKRRLTRTH